MEKLKSFAIRIWDFDIVHTFLYSFILTMIIECMNHRSLGGVFMVFTHPVIYMFNTFLVMAVMSVSLLFKRRVFCYSFISFIWILLALTNFIVLSSRKTPFTAMDLFLIQDAIKVLPLYVNIFEIILIIIGIALVIAGLVILWRKAPKIKTAMAKRRFYLYGVGQVLLVILFAYGMATTFILRGVVETHFGNLAQAYQKYGFAYCFISSVIDRGISKSDDYSPEYIDELKESLEDGSIKVSEKTPNIIFVQLESFFDPNLVKGVQLSDNPVPNLRRLMNEYTSGFLSVPSFGAGTANTEFEVQTGVNLDDFGPGEYPYRTVMKSKVCESAAYNLKKLGYATHAIHNNDATFYDRYKVFSHLGYDTFTSIEYMAGVDTTPMGWAKDSILTGEIEKALNSTEGTDYIFTISVQGHGDYPKEVGKEYTPKIKVSSFFDEGSERQFEYYVNQIYEMDLFIGELTNMLSQRDEETVLVMYGDHLPTFNFTDETLANGDIYQTPYFIWSNFDIEKERLNLEAFQLSAYVFEKVGISEGYIMKYHQLKYGDEDYLKGLQILEYDILYGEQEIYGGEIPFKPTELKMGIQDIKVEDAYNYKEYAFISGEHFNEYSKVLINNKEYDCELASEGLIIVPQYKLKQGDVIVIAQRGVDKIELSRIQYKVEDPDRGNG